MEQQVTNLYFELGVKPGVSPKQLKQAYRQSVMRYHPDTAAGKGNTEKFRQVTEAYQLLQKMNAYEAASSSKKTVSRTSNLRQKFSSVFFKKRRHENQTEKPWWDNIDVPQGKNEKIKVKEVIKVVNTSDSQKLLFFFLGFIVSTLIIGLTIYGIKLREKKSAEELPLEKKIKMSKTNGELLNVLLSYINTDDDLDKMIYSLDENKNLDLKQVKKDVLKIVKQNNIID